MAASTGVKYAATWSQWTQWCRAAGWPTLLPRDQHVDSDQLVLFAIHCWEHGASGGRGNAASTVLSKISHIAWYHRIQCGYVVGLHAGHQLALRGMQRLSPPPRAPAPASVPIMAALRDPCDARVAHDRVLLGAAIVGFFYLLRSGEYLAVRGRVAEVALQYGDVCCLNGSGERTTVEESLSASPSAAARRTKKDVEW